MRTGIIDRCYASALPMPGSLCILRAIWHVDVDSRYQVHRERAQPLSILLRTSKGMGTVRLADGSTFRAQPGEVLQLDNSAIRAYGTEGDCWQFCWFEYDGKEGLPPLCSIKVPNRSWEIPFFRHLQELVGRPDSSSARAASELFGGYLLGLAAEAERRQRQSDRRITEILDWIAQCTPRLPSVCDLARRCNLCERRFRALFRQETGESPKQYCEKMRLQPAGHLLLEGSRTIKEIAAMLDYSSQFAFSAAFRKYFGVPPSRYRCGF